MKTCINLTNGLRVHTDGSYTPCCLSIDTKLKNDNGDILNVSKNSIKEALNSKTLRELREQTSLGLEPEACNICWNEEKAGVISKRIRDNRKFLSEKIKSNSLHLLELNLGNICNLACRSCNLSATINWKNEHNLINTSEDTRIPEHILNQEALKYSTPFQDTSILWSDLKDNLKDVVYLDLYGGEPMLMKKQWEMLKYSVEKGYCKNQHVHFNTNGTIFKQEYVDLLTHFKYVDISFSLDGIGKKFDYIRHLGNWNKVDKNIQLWLNSTKKHSNFFFNVCFTVTVLNVMDFPEVADWSIKRNIRVHSNFVHFPDYYCITNIPEDFKKEITNQLKSSWISEKDKNIYKEHMEIINFMNSLPPKKELWSRFINVTKLLDKSRNQKFENSLPELNKIIKKVI